MNNFQKRGMKAAAWTAVGMFGCFTYGAIICSLSKTGVAILLVATAFIILPLFVYLLESAEGYD